jgi:GTPase SAR1 family protein
MMTLWNVIILSHSAVEMPTKAENVPDKKNDDIKKPDNLDIPTKIVDFIKNEDWMSVREELKDIEGMTLFQIIDVGGQPEFHDILPLLLTGPAIYLLFFNLNQKLDQRYTYLYQHEDGSTSGAYKSQLTVFQVLHQILSSISSMSEFSPAIVIGTHLDQLKSTDGKEFTWKPTDDPLKDRMKEHFYYEKSLIPNQVDGENCIVFPVDNINGTLEDEIKPLRLKIKAKLNELKGTSLPTSWALFYYLLRSIDDNEDPKYCTLDEAKSLAEGLKIKDVETVLKYFHERFGSVLYYHDVEDKDCNKYVFRDANVILRAVNEFVALLWFKSRKLNIAETLHDTGMVTYEEFGDADLL